MSLKSSCENVTLNTVSLYSHQAASHRNTEMVSLIKIEWRYEIEMTHTDRLTASSVSTFPLSSHLRWSQAGPGGENFLRNCEFLSKLKSLSWADPGLTSLLTPHLNNNH